VRDVLYRSRWLIGGAALCALVTLVLATMGEDAVSEAHPLELAPADARLVARVDVAALTGSHLWRVLLEEDDEGGVRRIERTCGYDPLAQVEDAVVFVFGEDDDPFEHLGFVATGEMARGRDNRERLVRCVRAVVSDQGGAIREVEIEGEPAVSSAHGGSHAAFLGADGVVGGDRDVVARTIRVTSGRDRSAHAQPQVRELWERVSTGRDIVVVGRLPERWLPSLQRLAGDESGLLDGLAGVRAFGLGVTVRRGLSIGADIETESPGDAEDLERELRAQMERELSDPMARFSVIGAALRQIRLEAQGDDLVISLSLTDAQIDDVLGLWRELQRRERDPEPEPDPEPDPEPEPEPE